MMDVCRISAITGLVLVLSLVPSSMSFKTTTTIAPIQCPDDCSCFEEFRKLVCTDLSPNSVDVRLGSVTKELRLKRDYIGPVLNATFRRFVALETIDLSYSQVNYIQQGALAGLINLKHLYLQGNYLRILEENLFKDNPNIRTLDLSQNNLMFLRDKPFRFLSNLKSLNVSYNKLSSAKMGVRFQVPTELETVDFSGNGIQFIFAKDFEPTQRWVATIPKRFNFSNCHLKSIDMQALSDLKNIHFLGFSHNYELEISNISEFLSVMTDVNLKMLDISYTNFTSKFNLTDFTAETIGPLSVKGLNLAGNHIDQIDDHLLTFMNIHWLDLSHNNLSSIGVGVGNLHALEYLDVSHNLLSSICNEFKNNIRNLEILKLDHNLLTDDSNLKLEQAVKLEYLDLSSNQLQTFAVPAQLNKLKVLDLSQNKIHSLNSGGTLVGLSDLVQFYISHNKMTQLNDFLFRDSQKIEIADFSANLISGISHQTFVPNCPKHIDLSSNQLEKVHHLGWHDLLSINLHGNKISEIQMQAFYFLETLDRLDLSDNEILSITRDTFLHLTKLTILKLNDNLLTEKLVLSELLAPLEALQIIDISRNNFTKFDFSPDPFTYNYKLKEIRMSENFIRSLSPRVFVDLKHLQYVDFSKNPFHCSCEGLAVQKWCKTTSVVIGNQENYGYICRSPKMRASRTLLDYTVKTFECNGYVLHIVIFSSVGGGAMLLAFAIGTVCWLWRRWRNNKGKAGISDQTSLDLVGYKKLNKNGKKGKGEDTDNQLVKLREQYLQSNPSDTLIDVDFEFPKALLNGNVPNGVGHRHGKAQPDLKSKDSKSKLKNKSDSTKKHKHSPSNGVVRDKKGIRFQRGYCSHSRSSLRKILSAMDKEYKKRKAEKKQSKKDEEEKKDKRRRSRGNRDLVRLVSLRGSRSMPDVLGYIESLPQRKYIDRHGNKYTAVPIHHVDHIDENQGGWAKSLVEIPRIPMHRSATVAGPLSRYEHVDVPRVHRSTSRAVPRVDHGIDVSRIHRDPDPASRAYETYDLHLAKRRAAKHRGIPDGYHTIASTRGRTLIDSRSQWTEPKTLKKSKSASNEEIMSKWL